MFHAGSVSVSLHKIFSSCFSIKVAHYNFCIMCWNSLIYLIKFILTGVLNKLILFLQRYMYQNYCKIIKLSSHFQWAYSIIHCLKVHNWLFILPGPKVLLSLPLYISMKFRVSNTPLPHHLISWFATMSVLYFSSFVLTSLTFLLYTDWVHSS